jgi:hypothetical protein
MKFLKTFTNKAQGEYGMVVVIVAGYEDEMETLFETDRGLDRRFPNTFLFDDFEEPDLHKLLVYNLAYLAGSGQKRPKAYQAEDPKYVRILSRRIGKQRGRKGFGNAGQVETTVSQAIERQSTRITQERASGKNPDLFVLTRADLLGAMLTKESLVTNPDWITMQSRIGWTSAKRALETLMDQLILNATREEAEQDPLDVPTNRCELKILFSMS